MSRISRYQESMTKFIKQKSCLNSLNDSIKQKIFTLTDDCDHIVSILFLTVMNSQCQKNGNIINGYHMATSIELMLYNCLLNDNKLYYENKLSKNDVDDVDSNCIGLINVCIVNNNETMQTNYSGTQIDKLTKMSNNVTRQINSNLYKLLKKPTFTFTGNINKTDVVKYKFNDMNVAKKKLCSIKRVNPESLNTYINEKYGFVCQQALLLGWIIGGGDEKQCNNIEKLGLCFGMMLKCVHDFVNIDHDLEYAVDHTKNIVLNNGFQNSFETFVTNKVCFIEGCIKYSIYTNTVKEIIDLLESKLGPVIDNSSPDIFSHMTIE